ncbi:somatostatin receptor type 2-like [Ciona intestinalis]
MEEEVVKKRIHDAQNIIFPLLAGVGIIANTFVIVVISIWERCHRNRTVANSFVVNLAIADLLFLVVLPLYMPAILTDGWIYGVGMCKVIEAIKYINFRASILFLTMMSVDRYLGIVFSMRSREYRTRKNAIMTCMVLWLFSIAAAVPILVFANVDHVKKECVLQFPGYEAEFVSDEVLYDIYGSMDIGNLSEPLEASGLDFGPAEVLGVVNKNNSSSNEIMQRVHFCKFTELQHSVWYVGWEYSNFALFFVIPILCIIFCYSAIIKAVLTRHIQSSTKTQDQHQVARMVALLVGVFILSWGPFQTWKLLTLPPGQKVPYKNSCLVIETIVTMMAWSNSAINPILYSLSSKRFWEKSKAAWVFIKQGQSSFMVYQASTKTARTRLTTHGNVGNPGGQRLPVSQINPHYVEDRHQHSTNL